VQRVRVRVRKLKPPVAPHITLDAVAAEVIWIARVYLSLGSNLGCREAHIQRAMSALAQIPQIEICRQARLYETEPVGVEDQPWFLNTVVEIETSLSPRELLTVCKQIERALGRGERERYGPREIDLDILLYDDRVVNDVTCRFLMRSCTGDDLCWCRWRSSRRSISIRVLRKTIAELLQELTDSKEVRPYDHGDPHRDRRSDDAHRVAGGRAPHGDSL
jgi:2-amino-4-hydroxy-6-hydroxymethyldihydropteridine diphosphokinase